MLDYRRSSRARKQSWFGSKKFVKVALSLPVIHFAMRLIARRIPGVRIGRLPAPRGVTEVQGVVDGGTYVLLAPDRCEIAKELYWGSGRRPQAADAFALDLVVRLAKDASTFLDIGAYTGVFTMAAAAANPGLTSHAFEIVPPVGQALAANVARNGIGHRTHVHDTGVGDPGATMRVPTDDSGSALPSFYSSDMAFDEGADVGFVSLDSLTETVEEPVVLKVDIEGGEVTMFRHGQRFMAAHAPDILCEVLPDADAPELEELLTPHGMRFYAVGSDAVHPRPRLVADAAHRDWLFTTKAPEELTALGIAVSQD